MAIFKKIIRITAITIVTLIGLYFVTAFVLIFWPEPTFEAMPEGPLLNQNGTVMTQNETVSFEEHHFTMRDGTKLFAQYFPANSDTTVLLIHGVAADGMMLNKSAAMIQKETNATLYAIDLRGHGQSGGRSGDVDYIGQYEADIADIVNAIRSQQPNGRIILAGHSMGGGIALRYALLEDAPVVDGHLLFAPNLGVSAPTSPIAANEETNGQGDPFIKLHIPRIIGLAMVNGVGITKFNGRNTMFFRLPAWRTNTYSYRAMVNSSPVDYRSALNAVDAPMLVLVGSEDEAFIADQFPNAVRENSDGDVEIIAGETHNGIYQNEVAISTVRTWMSDIES